jgi:branched-chain amino acid transport system ATP-binding protein
MILLEIDHINTFYGLSHILFDVFLKIERGEVVCLLGRNGAGKTTLMRSIMGLTPPKSGSIRFQGELITGKPTFRISRAGIGMVPENRLIFADLTVLENLAAGRREAGENGWTVEKIWDLFPELKRLSSNRGGQLSGGEQQMLSIARALLQNPALLLLDEPTEGLSPLLVNRIAERVLEIKSGKALTMLIAEQNYRIASKMGDRSYILEKGVIQFEGSMTELSQHPEVTKKYLAI